MSQENYTQEIFNQQLIVEASGHMVGLPGKVAYSLLSQTKDGVKYNQTLSEGSGLSRVYAEKTLQVECGFKNKENEHSYKLIVHKGNCDFNEHKGKLIYHIPTISVDSRRDDPNVPHSWSKFNKYDILPIFTNVVVMNHQKNDNIGALIVHEGRTNMNKKNRYALIYVRILEEHPYIFMPIYEKIGKKAFNLIRDPKLREEIRNSLCEIE